MDGSAKYTDLLLIGKTGNGKSATGNSILGRNVFPSKSDAKSVTKEVQIEYSEICGRIVKVVDGPGVCDTDLSKDDALMLVINCMKHAIAANPKGYHAILLVVRFGNRFTNEDQQALMLLKGIFGSDFVDKFVILVVTCADMFTTSEGYSSLQEWCANQTGVFRDLVAECRNRVVFFDNRTDSKKNEQRHLLFNMIDNLSSRGVRYTNEDFMRADQERNRLQVQSKAPIVREESMRDASLLIQRLGMIRSEEPQEQLVQLGPLKETAEQLHRSIQDQDKNTGALKDLIENAQNICLSIDSQIESATKAIEYQMEKRQLMEEIERYRAEGQPEMRITELQQEISERDARCRTMQERGMQNNRALENEYHSVAQQQYSSIIPLIIEAIIGILPMVLKAIFGGKGTK